MAVWDNYIKLTGLPVFFTLTAKISEGIINEFCAEELRFIVVKTNKQTRTKGKKMKKGDMKTIVRGSVGPGKHILLGGMAVAIASLAGSYTCRASGTWGPIVTNSATTIMPSPISSSGSGFFNSWDYSVGGGFATPGGYGGFTGIAETDNTWNPVWLGNPSVGIQTASGWTQAQIGTWIPDEAGDPPPTDAEVEGDGNAVVTGQVHVDCNNGDPLWKGSGAAEGYADVTYSGVYADECQVNLNPSFTEGATTVSGTLSAKPALTISGAITSGVYDSTQTQTCSGTQYFTGMVALRLEKAVATVSVSATSNTGAYQSVGQSTATVSTCSLELAYGGTGSD